MVLLFLGSLRTTWIVALSIPLSVLAAFVGLYFAGQTLNIMTLGGLALGVGLLLDNSIVVLENIFRHRTRAAPAEAAAVGAEELQGALTASTLTTIAVFGPVVYVQGVAGELFGPLSLAVAFALLASLVVALTLLPMMAGRWSHGAGPDPAVAADPPPRPAGRLRSAARGVLDGFERGFDAFARTYERALAAALDRPGRVLGGSAAKIGRASCRERV